MKLEKTFDYRNIWMGLATIWIVWFHSAIELPNALISYVKSLGYGGVDIFIFASGIGCYYSLSKNQDFIEFLKRRFLRIFPTYWCFYSVWFFYNLRIWGMPPANSIIGNILCIQNFTGLENNFDWYTGAICMLYLLAPLFYGLVNRYDSLKQTILMILILFIISLPFWNSLNWIIVMTRVPLFFLGMFFAKKGKDGILLNWKHLVILDLFMIIGFYMVWFFTTNYAPYLWSYGLSWYPFILIVPGMCVTISYIFEYVKLGKVTKFVEDILGIIGMHSFEVYLVQVLLFDIFIRQFVITGILPNRIRYQLCTIACIVPGCFLLNKYKELVMGIVRWIANKLHNNKIQN